MYLASVWGGGHLTLRSKSALATSTLDYLYMHNLTPPQLFLHPPYSATPPSPSLSLSTPPSPLPCQYITAASVPHSPPPHLNQIPPVCLLFIASRDVLARFAANALGGEIWLCCGSEVSYIGQQKKMPRVVADQKAKFETDELFKKLSQEVDVSRGPFEAGVSGLRACAHGVLQFAGPVHGRPGEEPGGAKGAFCGGPETGSLRHCELTPQRLPPFMTLSQCVSPVLRLPLRILLSLRQTFAATGTNISLQFVPRGLYGERLESGPSQENVDFEREPGKVSSSFMCRVLGCDAPRPRALQVHLLSSFILNGVCVKWVGYIDLESLSGKATLAFDSDQAKVVLHCMVASPVSW